ncbi:hypothetical protein BDW62DRAFT_220314 [Aspergillus aurantiobrunneus]
MSLNPDSKPVLAVLGVGPGIGEAVAHHFAANGFTVALIARTESKLAKVQKTINDELGPTASKSYIADARSESSLESTFAAIKTELGPVDVLIYNAASRRFTPRTILETPSEEFENFTRINLFGAFFAAKCVLPDMLARSRGTILFTGATGSVRGNAGLSSFAPGKFGLRALSQVIAREFQGQGVHVAHVLVDGPVESDLVGGVVRRRWERAGEQDKLKEKDLYLVQPRELARVYWDLYRQGRSAWTQELDVRSQREAIFSKL